MWGGGGGVGGTASCLFVLLKIRGLDRGFVLIRYNLKQTILYTARHFYGKYILPRKRCVCVLMGGGGGWLEGPATPYPSIATFCLCFPWIFTLKVYTGG